MKEDIITILWAILLFTATLILARINGWILGITYYEALAGIAAFLACYLFVDRERKKEKK